MFLLFQSDAELLITFNDNESSNIESISRDLQVNPSAVMSCTMIDLPEYLQRLAEFAKLSNLENPEGIG